MTLCPYGSAPNPSSPPYTWITWVDAKSWLGLLWGPFGWLAALADPLLVRLTTFCATEPTQPVYPGDATVAAAATDPVAFETILQYLKDSATWWVWSHNCLCNAAPGGTCTTPYASPSVFTNFGPGGTGFEKGIAFTPSMAADLNGFWFWNIGNQPYFSSLSVTLWGPGGSHLFGGTFTPGGGGQDHFTLGAPIALTAGQQYVLSFCEPSGFANASTTGGPPPTSPIVSWDAKVFASPCGAFPTGAAGGWPTLVPEVCAGIPTTPADPTVPTTSIPDLPTVACSTAGDLCSIIQPQVTSTALLQQRLDLLQRRLLPFAWIAGSPSTPLTGAGFITVQDAVGCIVDVTTVPASWGASADTPRRLYPAAGIVQGTSSSKVDEGRWIHYEHQVILWNDPWSTSITYNFKPGIVATITPIYPEL